METVSFDTIEEARNYERDHNVRLRWLEGETTETGGYVFEAISGSENSGR